MNEKPDESNNSSYVVTMPPSSENQPPQPLTQTSESDPSSDQRKKNRDKLFNDHEENRRSFGLSIGEDDFSDENHKYLSIKRIDVMDPVHALYKSFRKITIENVSNHPTDHILHKECGDSKICFRSPCLGIPNCHNVENKSDVKCRKQMTVVAYQVLGKNRFIPLHCVPETRQQPNDRQIVKICFPNDKPLKSGQKMTLIIWLGWPGEAFVLDHDNLSTSISLTRYVKGHGQLEFGFLNTCPTYDVRLFVCNSDFDLVRLENKVPDAYNYKKDKDLFCEECIDEEIKTLISQELHGIKYTMASTDDTVAYQIRYREDI